jgi:mannose-1-phosphate guanylyltransferase
VRIDYSVEEGRLLGTGGALKLAEEFFQPRALVLNGDTYYAIDYNELLRHHAAEAARSGALATLALARNPDAARSGSVLLDPSGRFLAGFREKAASAGPGCWLNAGAYVLERPLLSHLPPHTVLSLEREVLPRLLAGGTPVAAWCGTEPFYDIGTPEDLVRFVDHYQALRARRAAA